MPHVLKCPNCNAPLPGPPAGPDAKCGYCGASLVATRYMQAPQVPPQAPPPAGGPPHPQGPGIPEVIQGPMITVTTHRGFRGWWIVSTVMTLIIIGAAVGMSLWAQQEASDRVSQSMSGLGFGDKGPAELPEREIEMGKTVEVDLPGRLGATKPVVAPMKLEVEAEGPFEVMLVGTEPYVSCYLRAEGPGGKTLSRSAKGSESEMFAVFPKGKNAVIAYCDNHPSERGFRLLVRPATLLETAKPARVTMEQGTKVATTLFVVEAAGLWAVSLETEESSMEIDVYDGEDTLVGNESVDVASDLGVVEAELEPGTYRARASCTWEADGKVPLTFAAFPIGPEPVLLGTEIEATLVRFTPRRYYGLTLPGPMKIQVTLKSSAFAHSIEIQQADGVRIISSGRAAARRPATLETDSELPAGTYRIVVIGDDSPSEGSYSLLVEEATARRGRGR